MSNRWKGRKRKAKRRDPSDKRRSSKERGLSARILRGDCPPITHYRGPVEADELVAWFLDRLEGVKKPERRVLANGDVRYTQKPVRCPTFAEYCSHTNVSAATMLDWCKAHPDFDAAYQHCKSITTAVLVAMGSTGGYNAQFAALMAKNLSGWRDKVEHEQKGPVTLQFDADDEDA